MCLSKFLCVCPQGFIVEVCELWSYSNNRTQIIRTALELGQRVYEADYRDSWTTMFMMQITRTALELGQQCLRYKLSGQLLN